jgi:Ca2+-binding RTX toxin-like protein
MYTYQGDANLSGKVDADDYWRIDGNYASNVTGWSNGDFNYDGQIDGDDYWPIDSAYAHPSGTFAGTDGDDHISIRRSSGYTVVTINGTATATTSNELRIYGNGGNDEIFVDINDDPADVKITLDGGDGDDVISGGFGGERVYAGTGDDTIVGNGGKDTVYGEAGNDSIRGGGSSDLIDGGEGYDTLRGDAGNDNIAGGANPDRLRGSDGNDRLDGGGGRDIIAGEAGDDTLLGGTGDDVIHGGAGVDDLRGGRDFDQIFISDKDHDTFDFEEIGHGESVDADILS